MQDAWRAYLEVALGLTEAPRKKAQQIVRRLVGQSETTAAQLQSLAEELLSTSAANRESLVKMVRAEVDRALGALGLATADEVATLRARIDELEQRLDAVASAPEPTPSTADAGASVGDVALAAALNEVTATAPASAPPAPAKRTGKKVVAKKAVAKKTAAKGTKTPAEKSARPRREGEDDE